MQIAPFTKRLIFKTLEGYTEGSLRAFARIIDELNAEVADNVEGCDELVSITLALDEPTLEERGIAFILSISLESDVEQVFLPTEVFTFSESTSCGKRAMSFTKDGASEYSSWDTAILAAFQRLQFAVTRLYWYYERLARILEQVEVKDLWGSDTMEAAEWLIRCPRAFNEETLRNLAQDIDALNASITAATGRVDEIFSIMLATDPPEDLGEDSAHFIISMDFEPESAFISTSPKHPLFVTYAFHYDGNYDNLPGNIAYFIERVNGERVMRGIHEADVIKNSTLHRAKCIAELLAERYHTMSWAISRVWFA